MTDLVVVEEIEVLTVEGSDDVVLEQVEVTEIITDGEQGPPGPAGDPSGALLIVNQLSEFDTEPKKAGARANLGLAVIDGGTFF